MSSAVALQINDVNWDTPESVKGGVESILMTADDTVPQSPRYTRVPLNTSAFFRHYIDTSGNRGGFADGSSLPFLLEELVAHSAKAVALTIDAIESWLGTRYLPPIVDLAPVVRNAREAWLSARPDPIPPDDTDIAELLEGEWA